MSIIKHLVTFFFLLLVHLNHNPAIAKDGQIQLAAGVGAAFYVRHEYGEATFQQFAPEVVTYGYFPIFSSIWFRPGLRLNYSWQQPDMPQSFKIKEKDLRVMLETGLLLDWVVIPSLSYAFGYIYRDTTLVTNSPIISTNDTISGKETLFYSHVQFGIGFPILKGFIVFEPFGRFVIAENDYRYKWAYGVETTLQIF